MLTFSETCYRKKSLIHFVGNKAKGRISKRVFQESKARQNFQKTNISYLLIRTFALLPYSQHDVLLILRKIFRSVLASATPLASIYIML